MAKYVGEVSMKIKMIVIGLLCVFVLSVEQPRAGESDPQETTALAFTENVNPYTKNIEVRGVLGGNATAVAISGDYLYMGSSYFLKVIDISDPSQPVEAAQLATNGILQEIVIQENYAYLALDYSGLAIIDITNPLAPVEVSRSFITRLQDLAVQGDIVSMIGWESNPPTGMWVVKFVDISNPANPFELSKVSGLGYPQDIALEGNYAYLGVAGEYSGMFTLDISDPAYPIQAGFYYTNNELYELAVEDQRAYLVRETSLDIVDVSNPGNPISLGVFALELSEEKTLSIQENLAFVSGYTTLIALEISDPGAIEMLGTYTLPNSFGNIRDFTVNGTEVYMACDLEGLRVIDISGLPDMIEIGKLDEINLGWGSSMDIATTGNSAYLASTDTLYSLDITDRSHPSVLGEYNLPEDSAYPYPHLAVQSNFLYVTTELEGLLILDTSDPAHLVNVGSYAPPDWYPRDITLIGSYAYVIDSIGVRVLDISKPADPVDTGTDLHATEKIVVQGSIAYFLGYGSSYLEPKLRVYDISNPANPIELGSYLFPESCCGGFDIAATGNLVFISDNSGIHVMDASEPTHPTELSFYHSGNIPTLCGKKLAIFADQLFVSRNACGLSALDISDPINIKEPGYFDPLDNNTSQVGVATVIEPYLYLNTNLGIVILEYAGYAAMGRILQANQLPYPNVDISFNDQSTVTTDATGIYTLTGFTIGTHTITPTLSGYDFWPYSGSISFPMAGTQTALHQNFMVLPEPVTMVISPGVTTTLTLTNTQNLTTTLTFPPTSVSQPITITLTPTATSAALGFAFAGHAFELSAAPLPDLPFGVPLTLKVHYSADDIRLVSDQAQITLFEWNGSNWGETAETCNPPGYFSHDIENYLIEIPICRPGKFALFGPTNNVIVPLIFHQ